MPGLKALIWAPTPEVLFREVGGAKQLCSEFRFQITPAPGYSGEAGFISFDKAGRITVYPGYAWDGASGPTIDTLDSVCAALGHDVLYELMRLGKLPLYIYKPAADLWFYKRLQTDGMISYRAWAWYRAVSQFGGPGTRPENHPAIQRAPKPFALASRETVEVVPGYRVPA
jgi:hypothetical protein